MNQPAPLLLTGLDGSTENFLLLGLGVGAAPPPPKPSIIQTFFGRFRRKPKKMDEGQQRDFERRKHDADSLAVILMLEDEDNPPWPSNPRN